MTGYLDLLRQPGVARLVASMGSARFGGGMVQLVAVLFVLEHYHSPALAGLVALCAGLSGIAAAPVAGALLDRYGRVRLILLDYGVGVLTTLLLPALWALGRLPPWLLLMIVTLSGFSLPLSASGARSLLPLLAPRDLWDRSNALDSATFWAASIAGPALAGTAVALFGSSPTMAAVSATWLLAGGFLLGVREPRSAGEGARSLLGDALAGLGYLLRNPMLGRLSIVFPVSTLAPGILSIAVPVLVFSRFHASAALVGILWSTFGAGAVVSNLAAGALRTEGREPRLMAAGLAGSTLGPVTLALAPVAGFALLGQLVAGFCAGPVNVAMFGLRVRSIERAWFGRAMSISMMLNSLGFPIGAALGGQLVTRSLTGTLLVAGLTSLLAAVLSLLLLGRASQRAYPPVLTAAGAFPEP
ncbi:MAG TPA: MFS transporter [Candidatus Dormibacteraeota bacterium]